MAKLLKKDVGDYIGLFDDVIGHNLRYKTHELLWDIDEVIDFRITSFLQDHLPNLKGFSHHEA